MVTFSWQTLRKELDGWYINDQKMTASQSYKLALPDFVMKGREANLEFLSDYTNQASSPETFGTIKNDVRDIIMAYFRQK